MCWCLQTAWCVPGLCRMLLGAYQRRHAEMLSVGAVSLNQSFCCVGPCTCAGSLIYCYVQFEPPSALSDEAATQLWVNHMTARGFHDTLQIPQGEWLLQSAAGSVLCCQVVQMGKHLGIKVIKRDTQRQELLDNR